MNSIRRDRVKLLVEINNYMDKLPKNVYVAYNEDLWRRIDLIQQKIRQDTDHYLALCKDDNIVSCVSFSPDYERRYVRTARKKTGLGRYIRRHLGFDSSFISDYELDCLQRHISAKTSDVSSRIEIVFGNDIQKAYRDGLGGHSCMTGSNSRFVELYAMNPERISLAIYHSDTPLYSASGDCRENFLTGRSLLWNTDQGDTVLDLVYPKNNGIHVTLMREWAHNNGYVVSGTSSALDHYSVTVKRPKLYPYCDTFRYMTPIDADTIVMDNRMGIHCLQDTGGTYSAGNICGTCKCNYDVSAYISEKREAICHKCFDGTYVFCNCCNRVVKKKSAREMYVGVYRLKSKKIYIGRYVCDICFDAYAEHCVICGIDFRRHDTYVFRDEWGYPIHNRGRFCDECGANCHRCYSMYPKDELVDGKCRRCRSRHE